MSTATAPVTTSKPKPVQPPAEFRMVPIAELRESPSNPRKHFDLAKMKELEDSIREKGVLTPLLARPKGALLELAAGHRRFRAAKAAGVLELPVVVRAMDDASFLEVLVIENDQREDVHPLEEADGYRQLMTRAGYSVERIAERIGRSTKYVYDRVKLLELTKEAQNIFLGGAITAGHAILLARLNPKDQGRAIKEFGALFTAERRLNFDPSDPARHEETKKPVSVREFAEWVDRNVRFDAAAPDPMLFPDTVETLTAAREEEEKVVPITVNHYVPPDAKDGNRTFGPSSWKRADGERKSKTCPSAVTGVIVVGPGRGEAFKVCIAKKDCAIHWRSEQLESKRRAAGSSSPAAEKERERYRLDQERERQAREREDAERERWEEAEPAILAACVTRLKKLPAGAAGALGQLVTKTLAPHGIQAKTLESYMKPGSSAEDLVRYAGFLILVREVGQYDARREFPKVAGALGLNVKAILAAAAPPVQTSAEPAAKKGKATRRG